MNDLNDIQDILDANETKRSRRVNVVNVVLSAVIVVLLLVIVTLVFFITPMQVSGQSMYPTFHDGDKVLLAKVGYTIGRGDVVVFRIPGSDAPPIKRVIGLPGDVIFFDITLMDFTVNGEPFDTYAKDGGYADSYFDTSEFEVFDALTTYPGITVGENQLFVLGDNRNISKDSHVYGCIERDWITGKVILSY